MNTLNELKSVCKRSHATLLQDTIGLSAVVVILIVALHLPGFG